MGNNLGECVRFFLMSEGKGFPGGDELCCGTWPQGQSVLLSLFCLVVQNEAFENQRSNEVLDDRKNGKHSNYS